MEKNNYKVSEQTALLVDAFKLMDGVYSKVTDSLYSDHDEEQVKEIIEKDFEPAYKALEDSILKLIGYSIKNNQSWNGNENI